MNLQVRQFDGLNGGGRAASFGRHVQFHSICQSQCKWGKFFCIVKKISRNSFTREFYLQWRHVSIILWRKLCILLHVNKILQIHVLFKYQVTFVYCRKWFASLPLIWRREIFNMLFIVSKWAGALLFLCMYRFIMNPVVKLCTYGDLGESHKEILGISILLYLAYGTECMV